MTDELIRSDRARFTQTRQDEPIRAIFTTETPVYMYDPFRGDFYDEVLLMSGASYGKSIPLIDSHDRSSVKNVLGSAKVESTSDGIMEGVVSFAKSAKDEEQKVIDKHITDFSVGYRVYPNESEYIEEGETKEYNGRAYNGPTVLRTKWDMKELSLVVVGADPNAKARKEQTQIESKIDDNKENIEMNDTQEEIREEIQETPPVEAVKTDEARIERERAEAARIERERIVEIEAIGRTFKMDMASQIESGATIESARAYVLEELKRRQTETKFTPATIQHDEHDKIRSAATDAILIRSGRNVENPDVGANDLTGYSMKELCRHVLNLNSIKAPSNPYLMIERAMSTDDFKNVLANVQNKSLLMGWETQPETHDVWVDMSGSVPDFKQGTIARISGVSSFAEVAEGEEYTFGKRVDAKENFQLVKYGKKFAITWEAMLNDDLSALTDTPFHIGEQAKIKEADVAYAILTANAAMGDGTALFHTSHSNIATGSNLLVPGVASISEGIRAMKNQTDELANRRLNINPVYFIAPTALEGYSEVFFRTNNYADVSTATGNSYLAATRVNIHGGNRFTRVYDARLDANSAKYWYLAAQKGKTVKMYFLNGQRTPFIQQMDATNIDGIEMKGRHVCCALAVDWRGLYLNPDT